MKTHPVIVSRKVDDLIPYARNSRTHSDAQVAQIAASVREFGWTNPVLVDGENGIIAGHGRVLAARKLGMEEVPCIELAGLSDAQRRAYVIADNKLALNAGWDEDLLRLEIDALMSFGVTTDLLGFDEAEIAKLMRDTEQEDKGSAEEGKEKTLAEGINYQVIVQVPSETEQAQLLTRLEKEGYKCRALMF